MKEHRDDVLLGVTKSSPGVESTTADESSREVSEGGLTKEIVEQPVESTLEVAGEDHDMDEITGEVIDLNSSTIPESLTTSANVGSPKGQVVAGEEELVGKDQSEDAVTGLHFKNMIEHQNDVLLSVKKSSPSVDSTTADEPSREASERGLTKEIVVEQPVESVLEVDDEDHMMDEKTGKGIDLNSSTISESLTTAANLGSPKGQVVAGEDGLVGKDKSEDGVTLLHCKNMKEHQDDVLISVKKSSPSVDSTTADEPSREVSERGLTKEVMAQPIESVLEAADGDQVMNEKTGKEIDLNSSKIPESLTTATNLGSPKGQVVAGEGGLVGKFKSEDGVMDQSLLTDVVDTGKGEDDAHVTTRNLDRQAGVDQVGADSLQSIVEVTATDVQKYGNGTQVGDSEPAAESSSGEPLLVEGETIVRKEESERGLTKETLERPMESVQEVDRLMIEKTTKDDVINSPKILEPVVIGGVVVETLAGKDKAQDAVSNDASSECPDNPSFSGDGVNAGTDVGAVLENAGNLDQSAAVDQRSEEDSSHSTLKVTKGDAKKSATRTGVGSSKQDDELASKDTQFIKGKDKQEGSERSPNKEIVEQPLGSVQVVADGDHLMNEKTANEDGPQFIEAKDKEEEPERSSTKETVEQPLGSVQEVADGDCVMNEKTTKEDEVLTMTGLGSEEVVEGLEGKDKSQNDVSMEPSVVSPDKRSLSTEVVSARIDEGAVHVNTENSDQKAEVEKSRFPDVDERSKAEGHIVAACSKDDEATTAQKAQSSEAQASTASGIVLDKQILEVNVVAGAKPESSSDKMVSATTDEVVEIDSRVQTSKVEHQTICDPSNSDQLLNSRIEITAVAPCTVEMRGSEISVQHFVEVNDATTRANYAENAVVPEGSGFSYEEAHMERGEDAGVDIDEVLGWKDEIPGIDASSGGVVFPGKDLNANPEADVEQQEGLKSQQPKVYERRLHVESPIHDALQKSSSELGEGVEQVIKDGQRNSGTRGESLSELTVDATYSGDGAEGLDVNTAIDLVSSPGSKKRKALDSISEVSEKRPSLHTEAATPIPNPASKIGVGECIQRGPSLLTGPPSALMSGSDIKAEPTDQPVGVAGAVQTAGDALQERLSNQVYPSDMLSQLYSAAQDPMKGYTFLNTIIPFFHRHRASVLSKSVRQTSSAGRPTDPRKRKTPNENDPEGFELDDVNDSYWTDRIIENHPEEQPLQDNQNVGVVNQLVRYEQDKPVKPSRRSNKKRFFSSNHEIEAKEQSDLIERRRQNLATEVLMKFAVGIYFPSEIQLNKMFKRFGPLMESETEVNRQSGRARVVFKKCSDAEVAHSSAGKFNIFGSISVKWMPVSVAAASGATVKRDIDQIMELSIKGE